MQVIAVLKPFDSATKILSTDKSASIHLVVPTKRRLQQHLTPVASDSEIIEQLKNHLRSQLEKYFHVRELHYVATLLDPRLKEQPDLMPAGCRESAIASLRQMMNDISNEVL